MTSGTKPDRSASAARAGLVAKLKAFGATATMHDPLQRAAWNVVHCAMLAVPIALSASSRDAYHHASEVSHSGSAVPGSVVAGDRVDTRRVAARLARVTATPAVAASRGGGDDPVAEPMCVCVNLLRTVLMVLQQMVRVDRMLTNCKRKPCVATCAFTDLTHAADATLCCAARLSTAAPPHVWCKLHRLSVVASVRTVWRHLTMNWRAMSENTLHLAIVKQKHPSYVHCRCRLHCNHYAKLQSYSRCAHTCGRTNKPNLHVCTCILPALRSAKLPALRSAILSGTT